MIATRALRNTSSGYTSCPFSIDEAIRQDSQDSCRDACFTLCYAIIMTPCSKSGSLTTKSGSLTTDSEGICPPAGLRPARGPILMLSRLESSRDPAWKHDLGPGRSGGGPEPAQHRTQIYPTRPRPDVGQPQTADVFFFASVHPLTQKNQGSLTPSDRRAKKKPRPQTVDRRSHALRP